jgi:hypothetical protein
LGRLRTKWWAQEKSYTELSRERHNRSTHGNRKKNGGGSVVDDLPSRNIEGDV